MRWILLLIIMNIVFVEVKTRSEDFLVDPASAVTKEKQRILVYLADSYIKWFNVSKECRFDVISVVMKENDFEIDHIENAFTYIKIVTNE